MGERTTDWARKEGRGRKRENAIHQGDSTPQFNTNINEPAKIPTPTPFSPRCYSNKILLCKLCVLAYNLDDTRHL